VTQRSAKDMLRSLPRFAEGGEAGESLEETQKRLDAQRELFKSLEQQKSQFDAYQTAQEINRIEQERYAELQADIEKNPYKNVDRSRYLIQKGIRAPTRVTMGDKVYTVGPPSGMISSTSGGVLPEEYRIVDKDGKQRQEDIVLQRRRVAGPAPSAFALEKPEFDAGGYQKALTDLEVLQKQYADMLYRPTPKPASPPFPPPPPPAPTLVQEPVLPPQNLPPVVASVEPAARVDRGPRSIRAAQAAANLTPGVGVDLGFGYFDRLGNYIPAAKIVPIEEDMTNIPVADTVRPVESGIRGGLSPIAQMSIPAADISSVYSLRPMDPMGDLSLPENRNLMPGVGVDTSQGYYDRLGNFIAAPNLQPIGIGTTPVFSYREGGEVDAFIQRANGGSASSSGVRRLKMSGYQAGGDVSPAMMTPEQLDEFNRNLQRELDEENRRFEKSGGPEFYSAIRPAMEDINERVKQTLELYRMGRATEADVQKLLPSLSEYEIASQFGRTDTGGYRSRDIDAPSRDRLREFIEIQKPTIDANRPDMFPYEKYDPRGPRAQGRVLEMSKGGDVTDEMFVGTRPEDFPETSPVDTAVSDFISSRSKLVTDPQEFFRVMGQNIEEYHGKPLREDPQKYLTEQLGPGALAGTVGKTAKQLFSSLPSSEAPFVGRLDEFVSSLPGAVQKDQFLNQLKGKFRDYDIGRAQEALADLPGNAKLTPFELLNRVKRVYDPTTFTTKIDYPKIDDYHAEIDNPFQTKKGFSQKPLGVIHLLQGVNPTTSPDAAKLMAAYEDITNRLPGTTFYSFDKTDRNPVSLAQDIYKIASRAGLSSVEDLGMDVQTVLQNMSQSGSDWSKLVSSKTMLGNPGRYRPEEIKEVLNETARITGALPEENVKSLQKIAEEINARRTAKQDYSDLESQYHKSFPYAFAEDLEKANRRLWNEHREGKQQIEGLLEGLQKREGIKARVYRGQHSSLAEDSSTIRDPIAFSRFTEHTTDIPGLGKVDGIYVNELQSDRLDDIRKKGRMGGGPQEDITRLDKLDKQIGEAARQFADYKTAMGFRFMNETDKAKISDFNSKLEGLNTKRNTLLDRIREGEYSLKESFAGMEESPQVIQQLMAKNAVAGAMQLGKRFVAFPGAESAQSQLYEKLPNNLKQVVKDLGPGFELRPITLPKPDTSAGGEGGELTSYAIVWGNEAADRIKKQGVPFKDGGEVSTEDFIKRFSKGEMANDEFIQEMMTGTRPTDETTSPGILPPEIRQAVDVPLDFANLLIRGTAAVPIGGAAGLYKGITGGKYGTQEGVKEADTEAARMMAKITGEPKTQTAKDVLQFVGDKMQEYKLDAALPQLLTLPSPGPGAASALMRSYELAETPPVGTLKLAGDKGVKPATPPTDQMGFYSPAEKAVMGLPQDKGTASQMLAQITKTQGVKPVELRATGLEDYLKGKGNEPVTKQEIQDFLTNNRVQVDEVVLGKGQTLSPEAKKLSGEALSRMEEVDEKLASYFEGVEEVAGQDPYSAFIMLRSSIGRRAAKGDQEALDELNAFNLPPEIRDLVLEFGRNKNEYIKYTSQARKMEKPKFDKYNTPGGQNAREIYLTLPGEQMPSSSPPSVNAQGVLVKPMYATQPKFTAPSPHSVSPEADANRLAHIFLDERKDAKGNNVLFVQEMQSDWAQIGKEKGFQTKTTPYDDPEYKAARARATDLL
jgi:hypothetical protein